LDRVSVMKGKFGPALIVRIGVADIRSFGLTWEDCERFLAKLGYSAQVSIVAR